MGNTPNIRFKGFDEDWEQRKLGDITTVAPFKPYLKATEDDGKYEVIQQGDSPIAGYANGNPCMDYSKITLFGDHTLSLYKTNAPFFVASDGLKILYSQDMDGYFYYYLLERYKPESEGYKRHFSILKRCECFYPINKEEQEKIGEYFTNLDHLITLHQRKCQETKKLKEYMLQKMFPQKGEKIPEIRFEGFTGDWEQRKLGELVEIGDIDHKMPETVDNGIPYLMTGDFCGTNELNFSNVKMVSEADYELLSKKIKPEQGDILFARYASVGAVRYVDFSRKFLISYSCAIIKKGKRINSKYLYYFLTSDIAQKQIKLEINIGSQANIGISSMKQKIIIDMPALDEQRQIADYFSTLDDLITLHECKVRELTELKNYMLQNMFPKKGGKKCQN